MYWLIGNEEEQLKALKRTWEFIFGHGRMKCLEQQVALTIMCRLFSEVCVAYLVGNVL